LIGTDDRDGDALQQPASGRREFHQLDRFEVVYAGHALPALRDAAFFRPAEASIPALSASFPMRVRKRPPGLRPRAFEPSRLAVAMEEDAMETSLARASDDRLTTS
jgi:hypothetical protein